jgi:broad specificity phosphatase PhoE
MSEPSYTLYLARHGETEYNRMRLMQGQQVDAELNDRGRTQARALAIRFRQVSLNTLYSSPLVRAWETATAVGAYHDLAPTRLDLVSEMSWGDLEGRPIDSVTPYLKDLTRQWKAGNFKHRVGGGETILDVQHRASAALRRIEDECSTGDVVLVLTHGRFLRVLLATALPEYGLSRMEEFQHTNTGVYRLDYDASGYALGLINCAAHLEPKEASS